jgi:hypothetical protein
MKLATSLFSREVPCDGGSAAGGLPLPSGQARREGDANLDDRAELTGRSPSTCFEMGTIPVFGVMQAAQPATHEVSWDGNECKEDRKRKQRGVYWSTASRQDENPD